MRRVRLIALVLVLCGATLSRAGAAPITEKDRDALISMGMDVVGAISSGQDYATARKLCDDSRALAARSDPDEWALGLVDACYEMIAEDQQDMPKACALLASKIGHFERATASGQVDLSVPLANTKHQSARLGCNAPPR